MKNTLAVLRYLLSVHILSLFILACLRLILYVVNTERIEAVDNKAEFLIVAMLKGVQFDNMVCCYIIAFPLVVLFISSLLNKIYKPFVIGCNVYFILTYAIIFAVSVADIPYFSYFYMHMGGSVLHWLEFGDTAGMLLQESSYYVYFGLYIVLVVLFSLAVFYLGNKLIRGEYENLTRKDYKYYIPLIIVVSGLCFIGMRGRLGRYPLRVSGAYFCSNSFYNQLGINPAFFLLKSATNSMKNVNPLEGLLSDNDAIGYVRKMLNINAENQESPISREINPEDMPRPHNVVIILLESMSTEYLKMQYKGKMITPFLHELIGQSYYFENFYSNGINTNKGIASTLYGFPPIFKRTMMAVEPDLYTGLPVTLKKNGYETSFFLTHDPQYDNMYSFLSENGFDHIYSLYDYPKEKYVNNFGVQDDYLFQFGLEKLNNMAQHGSPFLATFMTVTNHPPYIIPDKFKDSGSDDGQRAVAFTDSSLNDFMTAAAKEDWYKNTIFVILGDHGKVIGNQLYDVALSYNHVPFILYSPLFEDAPKKFSQFSGQIDVFPTVMGLLNFQYTNNSLGIDLFREARPYTYFVTDDKLACIDSRFLYIYDTLTKEEGIFDYKNNNTINLIDADQVVADSMKNYAASMIITADYLVKHKLNRPENKVK